MAKVTQVNVQRKNDKGVIQGYATGKLTLDDMAGTVTIDGGGFLGGKWNVIIRPEQVTEFAIVMLDNVGNTGFFHMGGLIGLGIAKLMSRWAKVPALRIEQSNAEPSNQLAVVSGAGWGTRGVTRMLMNDIAALFSQKGYKGPMPNLTDEDPWKFPWVPVLVGVGLMAVVVIACIALQLALGLNN